MAGIRLMVVGLAIGALLGAAAPADAASPTGTPDATETKPKKHHTSKRRAAKKEQAKAASPAAAAAAAPAAAASSAPPAAQSLGSSGGWTAYASKDRAGRICYVYGEPQKSEPAGVKRKAMAMVTHRPEEKIANVVSFVEGVPLKEGSDAALNIGGAKFELFTKDDSAWARTSDLDKTIVVALAKGKQVVIKATPQKGPATTDTYALTGFAQALALIDTACAVKR
jgi:Invasion associated locus B (IalB) protein